MKIYNSTSDPDPIPHPTTLQLRNHFFDIRWRENLRKCDVPLVLQRPYLTCRSKTGKSRYIVIAVTGLQYKK